MLDHHLSVPKDLFESSMGQGDQSTAILILLVPCDIHWSGPWGSGSAGRDQKEAGAGWRVCVLRGEGGLGGRGRCEGVEGEGVGHWGLFRTGDDPE